MNALRTIAILWLRQVKRNIRSRARIIGSLGQPLLFLVALGFGFGPVYAQAGRGAYLEFLGPGVIAMSVLFTAMFSGIDLIWDRQFGFLKETLVAPVPRTAIMIGRTLGGATVAVFQGVLVTALTLLVGFRPASWLLVPLVLIPMALIAILFTALGTAIAIRMRDMQAFPLIVNFLIMPLFFLSGALFPVDGIPRALAVVVRANPLAYGVDAMRGLLTHSASFGIGWDLLLLSVLAVVCVGIGSVLFRGMEG
ncbi:ABC transporter permease [Candidatus Uhrbacteria bacterium]|nr:ABC transporter permease [Candidatus Uhrbacteria bacterium]